MPQSTSLKLLFVIDPISRLNIKKDTSLDFMITAQERGHAVYAARVQDLAALGDQPIVRGRPVAVRRTVGDHYAWQGEAQDMDMRGFDAVFMRKDPPFDMDYIYATYLLSLAARETLVLNDPGGLRDCNEKAYVLNFPTLIPETLVTRDMGRLRRFVEAHGEAVIKPLDGKGGEGILMLRRGELNVNSILELLTRYGERFVMIQRYVPEARQGDKRILLVAGEPLAAFLRVPASDDLRGNMSAGASVAATELTARDREICAALAPRLAAAGHVFVGIDVLGPYLTEINVTSPTGVQEARKLAGVDVSERMIAWVEGRLDRSV